VTAGLPAVAVRVPAHPVALAVLRAAGRPLAAPSANRFTELSPTRAEHVVRALGGRVDLVLDGGPTAVGIESTVVDLTGVADGTGPPRILRPGTLSAATLAEVLGEALAPAPTAVAGSDAPRLAPGMVERHYAPRAVVRAFEPDERTAAAAWLGAERVRRPGLRAGALLFAPWGEAEPVDRQVPSGPGYATGCRGPRVRRCRPTPAPITAWAVATARQSPCVVSASAVSGFAE
jgi:L-threonylcarbamoyladenylate synthase